MLCFVRNLGRRNDTNGPRCQIPIGWVNVRAIFIKIKIKIIQISKNQNSYAYIISPEYDSMVNRQRRGYLVLGLLAVSTFFVSIQTMSVPLFIFHLVLDCVFGIYAFLSFQVRRSMQVQNNLTMGNQVENMVEEESYFKEAV